MDTHHDITAQKISDALARNDFILYYQPLLSAESGEISGIECFIRWRHPVNGIMTASQFISVVKQDKVLSAAMDAWVLREALTQAALWDRSGFLFGSISVNVISWHLGREFVAMVQRALTETAVRPGLLTLEAHNDTLSTGPFTTLVSTMQELVKNRVMLAIDHFSLSETDVKNAINTPIHIIKINYNTLKTLLTSDIGSSTRKNIQTLRKKAIRNIVVGVESEEIQKDLQKVGIQEFQGSVFKAPLAAKHITSMLDLIARTKKAYRL